MKGCNSQCLSSAYCTVGFPISKASPSSPTGWCISFCKFPMVNRWFLWIGMVVWGSKSRKALPFEVEREVPSASYDTASNNEANWKRNGTRRHAFVHTRLQHSKLSKASPIFMELSSFETLQDPECASGLRWSPIKDTMAEIETGKQKWSFLIPPRAALPYGDLFSVLPWWLVQALGSISSGSCVALRSV